jgi:hypothetical protein
VEVKTLIRQQSLTLTYQQVPDGEIVAAITSTILGNPDGIRYKLLNAAKRLKEIDPVHIFALRRKGELIYVMVLAERITNTLAKPYITYYVRYVSFSAKFSAGNLTRASKAMSMQRIGNSVMKEGIRQHAENFTGTLTHDAVETKKKIYYAYVEESNLRSINFTEFFFEPIRNFSIITYSKFFPKADQRFSKPDAAEAGLLLPLLNEYYAGHSLYFLQTRDIQENYYILKEEGIIVAGVKAQIANWKIEQVPGLSGKILLHVLPFLPVFSRIINRDRFRFLTFDSLYCKPGKENLLPVLFQSVARSLRVYAAMIYLDNADPLLEKIKKLKGMGLLNRLFKITKAIVMARFINFTESEKKPFRENPVYFSGYDLT